jgi:hypothetical protein
MKIKLTVLTLLIVGLLAAMSGTAFANLTLSAADSVLGASVGVPNAATRAPLFNFKLTANAAESLSQIRFKLGTTTALATGDQNTVIDSLFVYKDKYPYGSFGAEDSLIVKGIYDAITKAYTIAPALVFANAQFANIIVVADLAGFSPSGDVIGIQTDMAGFTTTNAMAGADVDAAGATMTALTVVTETADITGPPYNRSNGFLDAVKLTFSQTVKDSLVNLAVTNNDVVIAGHALGAFNATYNGDSADNAVAYVRFDETTDITSSTPNFSYTASASRIMSLDGQYGMANKGAAATTDKAAPAPRSVKTMDIDGDGKIDRIDVQFSETLNADTATGFTVTGYTVTGGTRAAGAEGAPLNGANMLLQLAITEKTTFDTGAKPDYLFNKGISTLADGAGNKVESFNQANIPTLDAAAPTVVSSKTLDRDTDGQFDALEINFSEIINLIAGKTAADITDAAAGFDFNGVWGVSYDFTGTGNTGVGTAQFILPVNEIGSYDTAVQPVFEYNGGTVLVDGAATPNALAAQVPFTNVTVATDMDSAVEVFMQDGIAPKLTVATTLDGNTQNGTTKNGKLDTIQLVFSEPMGTTAATYSTLAITGHSVTGAVVEGANVYVKINEVGYDTGVKPDVTYAGDTIVDANGAKLLAVVSGDVTELDGAYPLIYSAASSDLGWTKTGTPAVARNGKIDGMTLLFSEPMDTSGVAFDGGNSLKNEFTFTAYTVNDTVKFVDLQTARVYIIEIAGAGVYDTDVIPDLRYTSAGTYVLKDLNGLVLQNITTAGGLVESDGAAPVAYTGTTVDANRDGYLDGVTLTFTENIAVAATDTTATLTNIAMARSNTNTITLTSATLTAPAAKQLKWVGTSSKAASKWDTSIKPKAILKAGIGIKDTAGNTAAVGDSITTTDLAVPVLVYGIAQVGSKNINLTFSESVTNDAGAAIDSTDVKYYSTLTPRIAINTVSGSGATRAVVTDSTLSYARVSVDKVITIAGSIKDAVNNLCAADTIGIIDAILPTLSTQETLDLNKDGWIDTIKLTFSEAINDANIWKYGVGNDSTIATGYGLDYSGLDDKDSIGVIWEVIDSTSTTNRFPWTVYGINFTYSDTCAARADRKCQFFRLKTSTDPVIPNVGDVKGDAILYLAVRPTKTDYAYGNTDARPYIRMKGGAATAGFSGVSDFSPNYCATFSGTSKRASDTAAPRMVSASMVSETKMLIQVTEQFQSTLPPAKSVFNWFVGTERQDYAQLQYIVNFKQDPANAKQYIVDINGNAVVPALTTSKLAFFAVNVIKDRASTAVGNLVASATDTIAVTPYPGVGVEQPESDAPKVFSLSKNFPNPFNPTTTINYSIADKGGKVSLVVYNMTGQKVRTLVNEIKTPGFYSATWDGLNDSGESVASGIYLYKIVCGSFNQVEKMTFIK